MLTLFPNRLVFLEGGHNKAPEGAKQDTHQPPAEAGVAEKALQKLGQAQKALAGVADSAAQTADAAARTYVEGVASVPVVGPAMVGGAHALVENIKGSVRNPEEVGPNTAAAVKTFDTAVKGAVQDATVTAMKTKEAVVGTVKGGAAAVSGGVGAFYEKVIAPIPVVGPIVIGGGEAVADKIVGHPTGVAERIGPNATAAKKTFDTALGIDAKKADDR